ncbi:MAG: DUF4926 domain-containing protein [Geitlerinemataceae cyanobacterium]
MVKALIQLQLLDVVALKENLLDYHLLAGQVGTIVECLAPDVYEVEFSDDEGQTYAMLPLHTSQLLQLKYTYTPEFFTMSNQIHQYGKGDNFAGNKIDRSQTNNFPDANLSGVIGSQFQDNAQVSNNQFNQTNNANTAELLQLVASLRQSAEQFPEDVREEIIIDIEDVETEIKKPETDRNQTRLKKRLIAIAAAATAVATPIAGMTDFANNLVDLGQKVGVEITLPSAR